MNIITLLLLGIIAGFTIVGFRVGLVRRAVELVGLVVSFLLAMRLSPTLVEVFGREVDLEESVALYTAWIILFLLGLIATKFLAWGLSKAIRVSILGWVDKLGGTVLGFLLGLVLASVILLVATRIPGADAIAQQAEEHAIARVIHRAAPSIYVVFRKLGGREEEIWDRLLEEVSEHGSLFPADRDSGDAT